MDFKPNCVASSLCDQPLDFRQDARLITPHSLDFLNCKSSDIVQGTPNDLRRESDQFRLVEQNWHLKEWLDHFEKRQASLVNELGWDKSRANFVYHGKQPYRRDMVNEIANWLEIQPYELLMLPDEALQLRQLREAAFAIASKQTAAPARSGAKSETAGVSSGQTKARPARRKAG